MICLTPTYNYPYICMKYMTQYQEKSITLSTISMKNCAHSSCIVGFYFGLRLHPYMDGLVQNCSISDALAMEILQFCTKPPIYSIPTSKQSTTRWFAYFAVYTILNNNENSNSEITNRNYIYSGSTWITHQNPTSLVLYVVITTPYHALLMQDVFSRDFITAF